jgi:hypothetical protein
VQWLWYIKVIAFENWARLVKIFVILGPRSGA